MKSDSIGCSSTLSRQIIEPFSNHQINKRSPMALVENTCTIIRDILASGSKVTMFLLFCTLSLLVSYTKAQSIDDLILAASNNNEDIYDKAYKGELLPLDSLEDYQLELGAKSGARDQLLRHQLLNDEIIKTAERRKRDRCYCDLDLFCKRSAECRKKRLNMQMEVKTDVNKRNDRDARARDIFRSFLRAVVDKAENSPAGMSNLRTRETFLG